MEALANMILAARKAGIKPYFPGTSYPVRARARKGSKAKGKLYPGVYTLLIQPGLREVGVSFNLVCDKNAMSLEDIAALRKELARHAGVEPVVTPSDKATHLRFDLTFPTESASKGVRKVLGEMMRTPPMELVERGKLMRVGPFTTDRGPFVRRIHNSLVRQRPLQHP